MIHVDHLTVSYNHHKALRNLSLHVSPGEFVLLTGPSGCGKSTLARCLNGLIPHSQLANLVGRVQVDGMDVAHATVAEMARHVGLVFQNPATQLFQLNGAEEVAFGPRNLGLSEVEVTRRVGEASAATGIEHLLSRRVAELSDGEKQRLAIAAVLAMGPRLLVLDEPTAGLDVPGTRLVLEALERLHRQRSTTIFLIEHHLPEASRTASRAVVLDGGQVMTSGPPANVLTDESLTRRLGLRRLADSPQEDWTHLLSPNGPPPAGITPLVALREVSAGYRTSFGRSRPEVLRGLNLDIYPGEFVALVGDNGTGKTTLARLLAGLLKPQRGHIEWDGGRRPRLGQGVGLLFQNPLDQLFCNTVDEEVAFGPRNFGVFQADSHAGILTVTGLTSLRDRLPLALSAGQQQRTALAAVLALNPRLVILDEPTMGQDWGHLSRFMNFLVHLNQSGTAILLITHDYKLVHHYARRVILLKDGQVAMDGTVAHRE